MLFESTTILLRTIVRTLESGVETGWDDLLESGNQCLYELHQMARSTSRIDKVDSKTRFQVVTPRFERAIRAIPHVKWMMSSVRRRDKTTALESGRAAISEMDGIKTNPPEIPAFVSQPANTQPASRPAKPAKKVHRHKAPPAKQKRTPVAKRKPLRASAAGSR